MPKQHKGKSFTPKVGRQAERNRKATLRKFFTPQGPFNSAAFNKAADPLRHN